MTYQLTREETKVLVEACLTLNISPAQGLKASMAQLSAWKKTLWSEDPSAFRATEGLEALIAKLAIKGLRRAGTKYELHSEALSELSKTT
jgi:hypothetical protein